MLTQPYAALRADKWPEGSLTYKRAACWTPKNQTPGYHSKDNESKTNSRPDRRVLRQVDPAPEPKESAQKPRDKRDAQKKRASAGLRELSYKLQLLLLGALHWRSPGWSVSEAVTSLLKSVQIQG